MIFQGYGSHSFLIDVMIHIMTKISVLEKRINIKIIFDPEGMWNTSRESLCNSDYKPKNCGQQGYYRAFPNSQKLERKAVTCSLHACQTVSNKQHKKLMFHEVITYTSTWKILLKRLENSKPFFKNSIWWTVEASHVIAGKAEFKNYLLINCWKIVKQRDICRW